MECLDDVRLMTSLDQLTTFGNRNLLCTSVYILRNFTSILAGRGMHCFAFPIPDLNSFQSFSYELLTDTIARMRTQRMLRRVE